MSIYVALIDTSEIVQKMLSHCLYYFSAKVLRFDNFEDNKSHFLDKKPDIIFIDWGVTKGSESVIYSVIEEMKPIPVVLLYRSTDSTQIDAIPSYKIPQRIKKPLDPKTVRDILTELVPKAKESKIHPFLKFPKTQEKKYVSEDDVKDNISLSKVSSTKDSELQTDSTAFNKNTEKEQIQTSSNQTLSGIFAKQIKTQENQEGDTPVLKQSKLSTDSQEVSVQKPILDKTEKSDQPLSEYEKTNSKSFPTQQTQTFKVKVKKEDINIDETTQNDLAPMAIKSSSPSIQENLLENQNFELNEKHILKVLNKYKDTLEFQELMEKVLSEYAKETVANILQNHNKITDLLQQPLNDFKESKKFKELVEQQIIQYVKKQLPFVIKEVVEQEIKKILGD